MPPLARDFFHLELFASQIYFFELDNQLGSLNNNNNNNNLFLMSHPSKTPNWCMGPCNDLAMKVYKVVHILPPSRFKPMTSYEEIHVLNH